MEGRQEGLEPLGRADGLSSLSGEVEAVGRVIAQCNNAVVTVQPSPYSSGMAAAHTQALRNSSALMNV
jgi:hypothetical protein